MSKFLPMNTVTTYYASIHMAGSVVSAKDIIQLWALKGACVQVTECDYVYTGGRESGFTVRFINYPRFPKDDASVLANAEELAEILAEKLGQISYTIERSGVTTYYQRDGYEKQPEVEK